VAHEGKEGTNLPFAQKKEQPGQNSKLSFKKKETTYGHVAAWKGGTTKVGGLEKILGKKGKRPAKGKAFENWAKA